MKLNKKWLGICGASYSSSLLQFLSSPPIIVFESLFQCLFPLFSFFSWSALTEGKKLYDIQQSTDRFYCLQGRNLFPQSVHYVCLQNIQQHTTWIHYNSVVLVHQAANCVTKQMYVFLFSLFPLTKNILLIIMDGGQCIW